MADENLRASDADRDRVADRLRDALTEGRISAEEHDARIDRLFQAKTYGELVPLTSDLPDRKPHRKVGSRHRMTPQVAFFSGTTVQPDGVVEGRTSAVAVFGNVTIDLRYAEIVDPEVVATGVFGAVDVIVPPEARVTVSGVPILGALNRPSEPGPADGPHVTVRGFALFGAVNVHRRPRKSSGGDASGR